MNIHDPAIETETTVTRPSQAEAEAAVQTLLRWAGENPARYNEDPTALLQRTFEEVEGYNEMVLLKDIRFESYCEHHMAPIIGRAHVAYVPTDRVVGISKLARVVDAFSKRLQVQEKMTAQIANTIDEVLRPRGVAVVIEGEHHCMSTRGVHKHGVTMVTSAMRGDFQKDRDLRRDFMGIIGNPSSSM